MRVNGRLSLSRIKGTCAKDLHSNAVLRAERRVGKTRRHDEDASQRIFRDQRSESTMRCDKGASALGGQKCGGRKRGTGKMQLPLNHERGGKLEHTENSLVLPSLLRLLFGFLCVSQRCTLASKLSQGFGCASPLNENSWHWHNMHTRFLQLNRRFH